MPQPNVLLICVDHWPAPLMHVLGHPKILTPTLDQLSDNGVNFTRAYSTTPTCIPARRALMTGTTAQTHGDRVFNETLEMDPNLPTMPQVFRNAGYQAYAVGKLHVYPQRSRIGFDEVILNEESRHHLGNVKDDFELFLEREGYTGQELTHAMGNNEYCTRPWHLPEHCHPTHWTTREMCRAIQRRDPGRPGFWYCSYVTPHPPVAPPRDYMEMYRQIGVDEPFIGEWAQNRNDLPYALRYHATRRPSPEGDALTLARMGFHAQCTYIDHQMRLLIGTLREEGLLDDTIIMFTCDHGDMLGNHGLWAKPPMFEWSARVPMILVGTADDARVGHHRFDDGLVCLRDVMPTLLDLCGLAAPDSVEGQSVLSEARRDHLYCEHFEDDRAMRMVRTEQYKLIWYPVGNRFQLFDVDYDPNEMHDLSDDPTLAGVRQQMTDTLAAELYGSDAKWMKDGALVGEPDKPHELNPNRGLSGQRGWR